MRPWTIFLLSYVGSNWWSNWQIKNTTMSAKEILSRYNVECFFLFLFFVFALSWALWRWFIRNSFTIASQSCRIVVQSIRCHEFTCYGSCSYFLFLRRDWCWITSSFQSSSFWLALWPNNELFVRRLVFSKSKIIIARTFESVFMKETLRSKCLENGAVITRNGLPQVQRTFLCHLGFLSS